MMRWVNRGVAELLPLIPKSMVRPFARRYVAGETMAEMLGTVRRFYDDGVMTTVDLLGEFVTEERQAEETLAAYQGILKALAEEGFNTPGEYPAVSISVKLTALGLLLDKEACYRRMRDLLVTARECGNFVRIDMEDARCTSDTIELYLRLREEFGGGTVGIVLQAYLRRTLGDTRDIIGAGALNFRLCKGIYDESRRIAFKDHAIINKNFTLVLEEMFRAGAYVGIATHNEALVWEAMRLIDQYRLDKSAYEFQMLLGVDPELRRIILDGGHRLRVYVPFGEAWHGYCMRRFKENPQIIGHIVRNLFNPAGTRRRLAD